MSIKMYFMSMFLLLGFSCFASAPSKYFGSDYKLNAKVKIQINKTYDAIDKFDKVELGALIGTAVVFEYDNMGNPQKIREYDKEGVLKISYVFEYGKNGLLESVKQYGKNDHLDRYQIITYKEGKKIEEKTYTAKGVHAYSEVYIYNLQGALVEKKRMNVDGKSPLVILYEYDSAMRVIKEIRKTELKENKIGSRKEFKYDSKGRISSEISYNSEGSIKMRKIFQYDDKGNLMEEVSTYPEKSDVSMKYTCEYDAHGNWIKRIHYTNKYTPTLVQMRSLEY